ncbi:IS1 family transposase [Dysgonomonas sp. 25]|uniref:IS1 family transposase n=1 Tax=Dysgonomonas sp. 25 TaxID=2302933 RepID=UPI0013D0077A|nr:IS1 family transposase [Dysgonomonas sp. 25]NDV68819.1 IS1 family transposase [Dysgonomonas sp. 25]
MEQTSTSKEVKCPKCKSDTVKNGKDSGKQRYRCKKQKCRCNFRRSIPPTSTNHEVERKCMMMYLAGVSVLDIHATFPKIDQQTIRRWIKKYGSSLEPIVNKNRYGFQQMKATYLSEENIETEIRTGLVFVEKFERVIISPLDKTPIFFYKRRKEAKHRK